MESPISLRSRRARLRLAIVLGILAGSTLPLAVASEASAVACDTTNLSTCEWAYYHELSFAVGPTTWTATTGCQFSDDIAISQKKATTWGESNCDKVAVRMFYRSGSWAGWTSWTYNETNAVVTSTQTAINSGHKLDPWE